MGQTITIAEEYLPATITVPPMTDEEFAEFCAEYPDHFIEVTAEGDVIIMPPNHFLTGMQEAEIVRQLTTWAVMDGRGLVSSSAGGYRLPNRARRAPDAAWISRSQLAALPPDRIAKTWLLTPEFIVELRSPNDRLRVLRAKMQEWIENGCLLAWMIDPDTKTIEVYRPELEPEVVVDPVSLTASGPVDGFALELVRVWDPMAS